MIIAYTHIPETITHQWLTRLQELIPQQFLHTINLKKERTALARSLAGRYLLSEILKSEDQPANEISLLLDSYKRPYLKGSSWKFSISHSGNVVVCVCSDQNEVGIDIEKIVPIDIADYSTLFTRDQIKELENSLTQAVSFYELWTAKEAISKAIGRGLYIDFKNLSFCEKNTCIFENHQWFTDQLKIFPGYCCTLAANNPSTAYLLKECKII